MSSEQKHLLRGSTAFECRHNMKVIKLVVGSVDLLHIRPPAEGEQSLSSALFVVSFLGLFLNVEQVTLPFFQLNLLLELVISTFRDKRWSFCLFMMTKPLFLLSEAKQQRFLRLGDIWMPTGLCRGAV